jgi:hypothetical protein
MVVAEEGPRHGHHRALLRRRSRDGPFCVDGARANKLLEGAQGRRIERLSAGAASGPVVALHLGIRCASAASSVRGKVWSIRRRRPRVLGSTPKSEPAILDDASSATGPVSNYPQPSIS